MLFVVRATGPGALPASQAEVDERRTARLARRATTASAGGGVTKKKKPRKKRPSVTDHMETDTEKIDSAVERQLIKLESTPVPEWPGAPPGLLVVLPGAKGHWNYIFNIKQRLRSGGWHWNQEHKLWYVRPIA